MSRTEPTIAERIVERLAGLGVHTLFGVHGANAEDVFDAAVRHRGIRPVIAKHEFGAGAMADGLARISGGPTAVLTTSGGGALNLVPALGESYDSRVPVLAIIGSAPRATVGAADFRTCSTLRTPSTCRRSCPGWSVAAASSTIPQTSTRRSTKRPPA